MKRKAQEKEGYSPWHQDYFRQAILFRDQLLNKEPIELHEEFDILYEVQGGMSSIHIGRTRQTGKLVAIKTIKEDRPYSYEERRRIAEEASAVIGISSYGLLTPERITFDTLSDSCRLILPFCAGGSLADRLRAGPISIEEIVFYALSTSFKYILTPIYLFNNILPSEQSCS